jgi:hypothetical protein
MKLLITILLAIMLTSCAQTKTSITNPETGVVFSMETRTLLKDVKDAEGDANSEGFKFSLGSSSGSLTPAQLACLVDVTKCE